MIIFLWAIAEVAIIPAPVELVIIPLTASQNLNPIVVAAIGTLGSITGAMIDYYVGQKAFTLLDSRFALARKVRYLEKRFHRITKYGFAMLLILGRAFPLGTLKPVLFFAGGMNYNKRTYILVIAVSSFVRYLVAATVGSLLSLIVTRL